MISHIEISGFKSLEKVSLDLGKMNLFIGANAGGKSNFFDALRVLQGIGYGFTIDEIFNGKPKGSASEVWEAIRGGSQNAAFRRWGEAGAAGAIEFLVTVEERELREPLFYGVSISPQRGLVLGERLQEGETVLLATEAGGDVLYFPAPAGPAVPFRLDQSTSALGQVQAFPEIKHQRRDLFASCQQLLGNIQFIDPSPTVLRQYSLSSSVRRMGEKGENFASLVNSILKEGSDATGYGEWLKQLIPLELDEVKTLHGALGEPMFAVRKGDHVYPAPALSDGTLRFAAIAAAFFQPDMPEALLIEEIENGIHPARLRLLIELLRSQSGDRPQVFATSHSPLALSWLSEEDYATTFLCRKNAETGASTFTPLSSIPNFVELVRKQPIADLFAEGWFEEAP